MRSTISLFLSIMITLYLLSGCGSSSSVETNPIVSSPSATTSTPSPETGNGGSFESAAVIVAALGTGINMGNTLDAPDEGEWALAAEEYYFDAYQDAGFGHVRIPITWDTHVTTQAPYSIDAEWFDRVEQIIDWALERDIYVMVNAHHESWLKNNFNSQKEARFKAIWEQVSMRFQNKSPKLLFEILNEPNGMSLADVDNLNLEILAIIRANNPQRTVIYSGNGFTPAEVMKQANIPDDSYLIANFHSYDPWQFAGQCNRRWGSSQNIQALENIYEDVNNWSQNNNIPVIVNEFGAALYDFTQPQNACNEEDRLAYIKQHVQLQQEHGIPGAVWCDGGSFQIYDRASNTFSNALSSLIF